MLETALGEAHAKPLPSIEGVVLAINWGDEPSDGIEAASIVYPPLPTDPAPLLRALHHVHVCHHGYFMARP